MSFLRYEFALGLAVATLALAAPMPAQADRLSDHWQGQRDYFNELTTRACDDGDTAALDELYTAAFDDANAVALNNMGWLMGRRESCAPLDLPEDPRRITAAFRTSAGLGYPIGHYNYGMDLIEGSNEVTRDVPLGMVHLIEAAAGGYALAAFELGMLHAEGRHGRPVDPRRAADILEHAEEIGLSGELLATLQAAVAAAGAGNAPVDPGPVADTGGGSADAQGPFEVVVNANGEFPLGYSEPRGSWTAEVVYVAQVFSREGDCWMPSARRIVGWAATERYPGADDRLARLLDHAQQQRQAGGNGIQVTYFATLDDGITFQLRDGGWTDSNGLPFMTTQAEAEAWGPRCASTSAVLEYPVPVRADGY